MVSQNSLPVGTSPRVLSDRTNTTPSKAELTKRGLKRSRIHDENAPSKLVKRVLKDTITKQQIELASEMATTKQSDKIFIDASSQTESTELITGDMLICDEPPSIYWKKLAAKRQEALEETLKENQVLAEKIEFLKKDKILLEEMVAEAKELASLVAKATE